MPARCIVIASEAKQSKMPLALTAWIDSGQE
jgi:hypothetical protein